MDVIIWSRFVRVRVRARARCPIYFIICSHIIVKWVFNYCVWAALAATLSTCALGMSDGWLRNELLLILLRALIVIHHRCTSATPPPSSPNTHTPPPPPSSPPNISVDDKVASKRRRRRRKRHGGLGGEHRCASTGGPVCRCLQVANWGAAIYSFVYLFNLIFFRWGAGGGGLLNLLTCFPPAPSQLLLLLPELIVTRCPSVSYRLIQWNKRRAKKRNITLVWAIGPHSSKLLQLKKPLKRPFRRQRAPCELVPLCNQWKLRERGSWRGRLPVITFGRSDSPEAGP